MWTDDQVNVKLYGSVVALEVHRENLYITCQGHGVKVLPNLVS